MLLWNADATGSRIVRNPALLSFSVTASIASTDPASTTSVGALSFATTTLSDASIRLPTVAASLGTAIMAPAVLAAASAISSPRLRAVDRSASSSIRPAAASAESSPKLWPATASASTPSERSRRRRPRLTAAIAG